MKKETVRIPVLKDQNLNMPFYVTKAGIYYRTGEITRSSGFEDFQIMQVVSGKGIFECHGKRYEVQENDLVVFDPVTPHKYAPATEQDWIVNWVCFNGRECKAVLEQVLDNGYAVITDIQQSKLSLEFERLIDILRMDTAYHQMQASGVLFDMIIEIIAYKSRFHEEKTMLLQIQPVIEYMWKNLAKDITIEELSAEIGVSVSYLCRIFKLTYGTSPIKYLIKLRLLAAKNIIFTNPERTIASIAKECGYHDVSYFCAEFKRYFNTTPASLKDKFML